MRTNVLRRVLWLALAGCSSGWWPGGQETSSAPSPDPNEGHAPPSAANPDLGEGHAPLPAAGMPPYVRNRQPDLTPPPLRWAIVRADNDYTPHRPYENEHSRRVPLPGKVREKIREVTLRCFRSASFESPTKYAHLFGPVFEIQPPDDESPHLYVYKMRTGMAFNRLWFIAYHSRSGAITPKPVWLSGRQMRTGDALFRRPFVFFDDLDLDGIPEVVCQERVHNGTADALAAYHYLHVGPDLSLKPILRLDTRVWQPRMRDGVRYINRIIEKIWPNCILVRAYLEADPSAKTGPEAGYTVLECPYAGAPFEVKERHVIIPGYRLLGSPRHWAGLRRGP